METQESNKERIIELENAELEVGDCLAIDRALARVRARPGYLHQRCLVAPDPCSIAGELETAVVY